ERWTCGGRPRLGHGGRGCGGSARRRAHRPRSRSGGNGAGGARGRRDPAGPGRSVMTWITAFLRRPPIGWWDLLDILVVWILIYEVLKLIRGTRAVQMALGGGVLVALFYGSRWGRLETGNWLIRNLLGYIG